MKPVLFHPDARLELIEAARYYASKSPTLAQRFYMEIEDVIAEVRERPTMRRIFDPPARRHSGPVFPYAVIYIDGPEIWIVAVMHFKQRPGYWRERSR